MEGVRMFEDAVKNMGFIGAHLYPHWFELAQMREEPHESPIRRGALLYNIFDSRNEGTATGVEEMFMHLGLLEGSPRSRELTWIMLAQRAARAISGLHLHGGGFDMGAHLFPGARFFEVDQQAVLEFKRATLAENGIEQPPSLLANYLEADVPNGLADLGFDRAAPTLMVWEGNTMYLPPESIMPFLNRLAETMTSFRIAFDYFAVDLQDRESVDPVDRRRLEDVERAMGASFPTGFAHLKVFEEAAPFRVAEDGSFAGLAEEFGLGEMVAGYPEDWRETLKLYRYCVLERARR